MYRILCAGRLGRKQPLIYRPRLQAHDLCSKRTQAEACSPKLKSIDPAVARPFLRVLVSS